METKKLLEDIKKRGLELAKICEEYRDMHKKGTYESGAAKALGAAAGSRLAWIASHLTMWRVDIGNRAEMQWIDETGSTRKIEVEIKGADSFSDETDLQLLEMAIGLAIHAENPEGSND